MSERTQEPRRITLETRPTVEEPGPDRIDEPSPEEELASLRFENGTLRKQLGDVQLHALSLERHLATLSSTLQLLEVQMPHLRALLVGVARRPAAAPHAAPGMEKGGMPPERAAAEAGDEDMGGEGGEGCGDEGGDEFDHEAMEQRQAEIEREMGARLRLGDEASGREEYLPEGPEGLRAVGNAWNYGRM